MHIDLLYKILYNKSNLDLVIAYSLLIGFRGANPYWLWVCCVLYHRRCDRDQKMPQMTILRREVRRYTG
jgi:hypothetical protein